MMKRECQNAQGKEKTEQNRASFRDQHNGKQASTHSGGEVPRELWPGASPSIAAVVVQGRPRFQYSGYWSEFVDVCQRVGPIPTIATSTIDGQYLINVLSGVRLALVVAVL
jgi:hypothetical protein